MIEIKQTECGRVGIDRIGQHFVSICARFYQENDFDRKKYEEDSNEWLKRLRESLEAKPTMFVTELLREEFIYYRTAVRLFLISYGAGNMDLQTDELAFLQVLLDCQSLLQTASEIYKDDWPADGIRRVGN